MGMEADGVGMPMGEVGSIQWVSASVVWCF